MSRKQDLLYSIDRKAVRMMNDWFRARDGREENEHGVDTEPDPAKAADLESKLHDLLLAKRPGVIYEFSGLAVYVDDRTPAGRVMTQEMVVV